MTDRTRVCARVSDDVTPSAERSGPSSHRTAACECDGCWWGLLRHVCVTSVCLPVACTCTNKASSCSHGHRQTVQYTVSTLLPTIATRHKVRAFSVSVEISCSTMTRKCLTCTRTADVVDVWWRRRVRVCRCSIQTRHPPVVLHTSLVLSTNYSRRTVNACSCCHVLHRQQY